MIALRYIITIIALFSSILYVTNIITVLSTDPLSVVTMKKENNDVFESYARFRLVLAVIMSLTWGYLIVF